MYKEVIRAPFPKTAAGLDEERFFAPGGMGEAIAVNRGYTGLYTDEMDPELVAYWASYDKGLKKEVRHGDSRWNESRKFVTYTPLSAFLPENRDRQYPLMMLLTGSRDAPFLRETMGFCQMCAREEIILLIPASGADYALLSAVREAADELPVDRSRIYVCGFSNGAFRTSEFSIMHPDIVAACCSFGTEPYACLRWEPTWEMRKHLPNGQTTIATSQRTIPFSPQVYETVKQAGGMPFIHIMGACEAPRMIPFYEPCPPELYAFYHSSEYIIDQVNRKLAMNGCQTIDLLSSRACRTSENEVERVIGMPFDETHIEQHDGVSYYFGDVRSADGVIRSRFVGVENMPHDCGGSYPQVAWDFLKQFTRQSVDIDALCDFDHKLMLATYPGTYWPLQQPHY